SRDYPLDFAQLDCFACHQQLKTWSQFRTSQSAAIAPPVWRPADYASPLSLLLDTRRGVARWDQAVQAYLAVRAGMGDITVETHPQAAGQIAAANSGLGQLARYL